jgi:hypothetical protein
MEITAAIPAESPIYKTSSMFQGMNDTEQGNSQQRKFPALVMTISTTV